MSPSLPPKPYVYLNFSSFDTLEAAKELFVAFCGKGLTWHPPNEAHTLCHVCGRSGCSPSVCNPCPTRKVDDRLNKLYSRFNADRDPPLDPVIIRPHPDPTITIIILILSVPISTSTTPSNNPNCTLSQHIIDKLKAQIEKIANTFNTLEETVSWMNDTITAHEYRLSELESMMNYDNPGDSDLYPPHDYHENQNHSYDNGWDDAPTQDTNSEFNLPPHTFPSLIDTSPDASFSALDSNSVLSRRHVPLPNSRPTIITSDTTASRLQLEISSVTNGFHPSNSAIAIHNINSSNNSSFSSSPLINFGQINVNGLCSPVRQLHLLNYFLHSSFGVLSLNDTRLTSSTKARLKQKSEKRTIFLYKNIKEDTWDIFSDEVNSRLELYLATHHPSIFSLSALSLDKLWHALKRSILGGAIESLPFQHVSNTHHHKYPPELTMLIAINKFLDRLLFKLTTSRISRPAQILQMINSLPIQLILLKSLLTDYTIPDYSTTPLPAFVKFLRSQKALVSAFLFTQFHQHR
ncbi:hypothetical protein RhiirA5_437603, partial [Rhizophagus irregularis]